MKQYKHRLEKLERQINGDETGQITITLGDEAMTFKNSAEVARVWIEALISCEAGSGGEL